MCESSSCCCWVRVESLARDTLRGFAWDVLRVRVLSGDGTALGVRLARDGASGSVPRGYEVGNVLLGDEEDAFWGGRADASTGGKMFLELHVEAPLASLGAVTILQRADHFSRRVRVLAGSTPAEWTLHAEWTCSSAEAPVLLATVVLNRETWGGGLGAFCRMVEPATTRELTSLAGGDEDEDEEGNEEDIQPEDMTTPPSGRPWIRPHPVSLKARLHPAPPPTRFTPDPAFYNSVCVDGLWICSSKSVEPLVLARAATLVRAVIPQPQRALWGMFQSPKEFKDPGPMRIIILDNRSDEQAGCIPELQDESTGRNGTACPFVFTSREDLLEGVGGTWKRGALTCHEMTHGADMVIRQLVDPFFNDLVFQAFVRSRHKYQHPRTRKALYASSHRDEFLAETLCIALGFQDQPGTEYEGMSTRADLARRDPGVLRLLSDYFLLPTRIAWDD